MIVRSLLLLLPLTIWTGLIFFQRLSAREMTASFLGFVWTFQACLIINVVAINLGAWKFLVAENLFYGVPIDEVLSLSIILGALIPLTRLIDFDLLTRFALQFLSLVTIFFVGSSEVLTFSTTGLLFTAHLLVGGIGMLLSDWTALEKVTLGRVLIQSLAWVCLLFWLFPSTVFVLTPGSWETVLERGLLVNLLLIIPLLIPA